MSSPSSFHHQESAARLLEILSSTTDADVEINDEATHGLFGYLYSGQEFLEALIEAATTTATNEQQQHPDNVGMPVAVAANETRTMVPRSQDHPWTTFLSRQREIITPRDLPLEIHNLSNVALRVRWINQQGGCSMNHHDDDDHDDDHEPLHLWDIAPQSTWEQYCQPGHLFVLSLVVADDDDSNSTGEQVVGAYRPQRPLPSLTAHALLVQEIDMPSTASAASSSSSLLLLETMLLDSTRFDALTVAAADLDYPCMLFRHTRRLEQRETLEQTIHLLQTIVQNVVLHHPNDEKYHKLKLSNSKLRRYIVDSSWGAKELLTILGFVEKSMPAATSSSSSSSEIASSQGATDDKTVEEDNKKNNNQPSSEPWLVMVTPTPPAALDIGRHALTLLDILQARVSSQFVAELAPPTPWQAAPAGMGSSSRPGEAWTAAAGERGRFVITDEERWARAERVAALRRSGAGRRPSPGNAPSSRGKWGR